MSATRTARRPVRGSMQFDIAIGQQVRNQRVLRNVTQSQLANAAGVSFQQMQKYESGATGITAGRLLQIAHFLGVPVAEFFAGLETNDPSRYAAARQRQ